jgi:biotin carboxylase
VAEVGYPIIIKPDTGIGAQDTHKIRNLEELQFFLERRKPYPYIMEAFVTGEIVTFDGLTNSNGDIVFFTSHEYSLDARKIASEARDFYYYNYREIPEKLEKAGTRCLEVMQVREKFFHLEFFRTADGNLVGIEINLRPPGGMTTDMMNYAHDMDVYDLWAGVVTGQIDSYELERKFHCAHVSRRKRYDYKYSHEQILDMLGDRLSLYSELPAIYAEVMGEFAYLVRYETLDEVREVASLIHQAPDNV